MSPQQAGTRLSVTVLDPPPRRPGRGGNAIADPLIGLAITALILHITWQSWQTVRGRRHEH